MDEKALEYYRSLIKKFTLLDDTFMRIIFQNKECTQLLIQLLLDNPKLKVKSQHIQNHLDNIATKSIIMDVLATDEQGNIYNIEVQRESAGASPQRARYHSSMLDTHILKKGKDTKELPKTYIIFITEKDILGYGKILYTIKRKIEEVGEDFGDGSNILYLNTSIQDDSPLGKLAHDFRCSNPDEMNYDILKKEVKINKVDEIKERNMCQIMQQLKDEGKIEGKIEGKLEEKYNAIVNFFKNGVSVDIISKSLNTSIEEIKNVLEKNGINI